MVDEDRSVLVGALVVSPRAGEVVAELTLAIRAKIPLPVLADTLHAFPTFSRILDGMLAELTRPALAGMPTTEPWEGVPGPVELTSTLDRRS